jgi:hypothetical protein
MGPEAVEQKLDEELDEELEQTFPASDPPSIVQPHADADSGSDER